MTRSRLKVIITDDDESDRLQIIKALDDMQWPYEPTETVDINEALAACERTAFDCAIVDYQLPGRDGLEGVAALGERFPYMPIVMATSYGDASVATEAMKRGAADYIAKAQLSASSLRRIIENAVDKAALRRKLAQQREELELFAEILVHDLKSPITSIRAFTKLIEVALRAGPVDPDKIRDYCRRLARAGERMNDLIETLHGYTHAGAFIVFETVELSRVMSETLDNLQHLVRPRGARVTHGDLPSVHGNGAQLVQLLQNLIGNAIKYCEASEPRVHVSAIPYRVTRWLVSIEDNGIGIAEADRERIFEAFHRLHDRRRYEGTGLGLATCKKIVERHGGKIWCTSNEARGTTFFFDLADPMIGDTGPLRAD
jgi:signal transduction histidine kinase